MRCLSADEAGKFAELWLPAWTGNDPVRFANFYSEDALYVDPSVPQGVNGKEALIAYFRKLLGQNPNWVWTQIKGIPMEDGFLNKWHAAIPVGDKMVEAVGVCIVQLDDAGKIRRNEVYFDRTELVAEIQRHRAKISLR